MSSGQANYNVMARGDGFETRDFYLACFLRCTGYELLDLRAEGRRKVQRATAVFLHHTSRNSTPPSSGAKTRRRVLTRRGTMWTSR